MYLSGLSSSSEALPVSLNHVVTSLHCFRTGVGAWSGRASECLRGRVSGDGEVLS